MADDSEKNYLEFMEFVKPWEGTYGKIPIASRKRGKNSIAHNMFRSKPAFRRHMTEAMRRINNGTIPIAPHLRGRLTATDIHHLKDTTRNVKTCMNFLKHDKQRAKTATLIGDIINGAIESGKGRNLSNEASSNKPEPVPPKAKPIAKPKLRPKGQPAREHEFEAATEAEPIGSSKWNKEEGQAPPRPSGGGEIATM